MAVDRPYPKGPICTRDSLVADLRGIGLNGGETLLLHSSLRSLGWVCGGAEAVVLALLDVLGPQGTLVVSSQTSDNSDPARWKAPPVPEEWWPIIRENTPAYDPRTSRTRSMGAIAEIVRTWPGAIRSVHPQSSFVGIGPRAEALMAEHPLDCRGGEQSPLAKLEEAGAQVMLLEVGFDRCTAFHMAEYRVPSAKMTKNSFAATTSQGREWVTVMDVELGGDNFEELGNDFARSRSLVQRCVGGARTWVFPIAPAVAYAKEWLSRNES